MDLEKPKKVRRVSAIHKNSGRSTISKNKTVQISRTQNDITMSERADRIERVIVNHAKKVFFGRFSNLRNVRKLVIIWLTIMATLVLMVGVSRNMNSRSVSEDAFTSGGVYSEGIYGEIKTLNPIFASTEPEKSFEKLAFSRLYDIDNTGSLKGDLASSVSSSDNYKNFTIKMRNNAIWSDGQKISADDVIFTVKLLKDQVINPSNYKSWQGVDIYKNNDYELKFSVPTSSSSVLYSLNFSILPKHILENVSISKMRENDFSKNPITSGAFNFKSLQVREGKTTVVLNKNSRYYKGSPKLDGFEISAFQNMESLKKALIEGDILASPSVSLNDFEISDRKNFNEIQTPVNRGIYAFMNTDDEILKNIEVRQAIQFGLDLSKIRKNLNSTDALDYPTLSKFLNTGELVAPDYNLAQAEKKLNDAGWNKNSKGVREKDGKKLSINITTTSISNLSKISQEIKKQLEDLGFEVKSIIIDKDDKTGAFIQSVLRPRNYGILVYEIDLGADPDIYAFWHSSRTNSNGLNFSNYKDAIADDFLFNARRAKNNTTKKEQLTLFVKRWLKRAPAIGVSQTKSTYVYRKTIKAYSNDSVFVSEVDRYADVLYWGVKKSTLYKTP